LNHIAELRRTRPAGYVLAMSMPPGGHPEHPGSYEFYMRATGQWGAPAADLSDAQDEAERRAEFARIQAETAEREALAAAALRPAVERLLARRELLTGVYFTTTMWSGHRRSALRVDERADRRAEARPPVGKLVRWVPSKKKGLALCVVSGWLLGSKTRTTVSSGDYGAGDLTHRESQTAVLVPNEQVAVMRALSLGGTPAGLPDDLLYFPALAPTLTIEGLLQNGWSAVGLLGEVEKRLVGDNTAAGEFRWG
jgi:hypothetical protein